MREMWIFLDIHKTAPIVHHQRKRAWGRGGGGDFQEILIDFEETEQFLSDF